MVLPASADPLIVGVPLFEGEMGNTEVIEGAAGESVSTVMDKPVLQALVSPFKIACA